MSFLAITTRALGPLLAPYFLSMSRPTLAVTSPSTTAIISETDVLNFMSTPTALGGGDDLRPRDSVLDPHGRHALDDVVLQRDHPHRAEPFVHVVPVHLHPDGQVAVE